MKFPFTPSNFRKGSPVACNATTSMGEGASSQGEHPFTRKSRASVLEDPQLKLRNKMQNQGKPLDASDIKSLEEAKEEIRRLRKISQEKDHDRQHRFSSTTTVGTTSSRRKVEARAAVMARGSGKDYVKKTIHKSDHVRNLIYHSIKKNMLFGACSEEELQDLIDVFDTAHFKADSVVIQQGDEGDLFYVVETGELDVMVKSLVPTEDSDESSFEELQVGVQYSGSSFGELALMYGSPRAATIRAITDCMLWSLDRTAFKGITESYKQKRDQVILEFIRKVKIGDTVLGDVLNSSDIDAMALAIQTDCFEKGDVIIRQGETGDAFYIIESGTVDVFTEEKGKEPIAQLESGQFFGEKALISEDVRQATCVASSDVKCLTLMREDFVRMLGNFQDLLSGGVKRPSPAKKKKAKQSEEKDRPTISYDFKLEDLEIKRTLGKGAFGRVRLCKIKPEKLPANANPDQTYALKCISKALIVENGVQSNIINEKNIMSELNHPFILKFHCAMQDENNVYFLMEILLGGELFRTLVCHGQFPESWSRFYAASVVLAFCDIHARNIAYRDLKPENLVMDAQGYLKVVDFGLARKLKGGKTWTVCGTPDYFAPEIILNEGHDWAVDYWALGVLIYEMTAGTTPFYAEDPMEVYEKILSGHVSIPFYFSRALAELVKKLLKTSQSKRLGRTKGGTGSIMKQKWFSGFDWHSLLARKLEVPLKPDVKDFEDASNFDEHPDDDLIANEKPTRWNPVL